MWPPLPGSRYRHRAQFHSQFRCEFRRLEITAPAELAIPTFGEALPGVIIVLPYFTSFSSEGREAPHFVPPGLAIPDVHRRAPGTENGRVIPDPPGEGLFVSISTYSTLMLPQSAAPP